MYSNASKSETLAWSLMLQGQSSLSFAFLKRCELLSARARSRKRMFLLSHRNVWVEIEIEGDSPKTSGAYVLEHA